MELLERAVHALSGHPLSNTGDAIARGYAYRVQSYLVSEYLTKSRPGGYRTTTLIAVPHSTTA